MLICLSLLCFWSCSTNVASSRGMSPQERAQLIEQLQEARQRDLINATHTELGPDAAGDYMMQAEKAQTAINDLYSHSNVSKSEISDALFVPPAHLSPTQRAELIYRLEQAKALDDQKWHNNLGGKEPLLTEDCNIQSRLAQRVISNLETGRPVPWWEINDAMYVPDEVY
jgi:hypothetical protein